MNNNNTDCIKHEPSAELSNTVVNLMKLFVGKELKDFPMVCLSQWLNGTLEDIDRGKIKLSFKVRPEMTNPSGFFHGGIQCAMLDDAMGTIAATLGYDVALLSTNLSVDYLGTAKNNDIVTCSSWIVREGTSMIHTVGELRDINNELISKAQSNLIISNQHAEYVTMIEKMMKG